jgi:hypothetical protein
LGEALTDLSRMPWQPEGRRACAGDQLAFVLPHGQDVDHQLK